jgi:cysteine desulfurase
VKESESALAVADTTHASLGHTEAVVGSYRGKGVIAVEVYLDNAATTPVLPAVKQALIEVLDIYGNPSSLHEQGAKAQRVLDQARTQMQRGLGLRTGKIIFTGGGTEANNTAIFGTVARHGRRGHHLVTTAIEHPSVLEAFRALERQGWSVSYVMPQSDGSVEASDILHAVTPETVLVSMMHVNNETGAVLPIEEVADGLSAFPKTLLHVDGIQGFGKVKTNLHSQNIHMYSVSGHKLGAPKGIGALYVRAGLDIHPLLYGGGQEFGLRSGTENIPGIHAFAVAAKLASDEQAEQEKRVFHLRTLLRDRLKHHPRCIVHEPRRVSPYILSVSFPLLKGEVLVHAMEMEGVYVSTGSACSTKGGRVAASHVLQAMHVSEEEITGTLRLSLARWTTEAEVLHAADVILKQVDWLYEVGGIHR